ncbi:MAG TPA: YicC/YloC family endoribonuclease [Mesorhizobium sp.]|jgi:uncharacterized protein (TIGR00255 family)|nr:YicC/YloC family endoribonuclease [Mesorhizobium sp.]
MTGFARASAVSELGEVAWELRSVNGKGLEVRLRLPPGHDRLEPQARQAIARRFARGNIQASLILSQGRGLAAQPVVNEEFLRDLAGLAQRLHEQFGAAPARADGLLALRGVLEAPEAGPGEESRAAVERQALAALDDALMSLTAVRSDEGETLRTVLLNQAAAMEALAARIEADPSRDPQFVRDRLATQVRQLLDAGVGLDETRLAMEAALLAAKADVREELDRLRMHIEAVRALLAEGGAIGRRLDFLAQELNRESNTLCAKSNAAGVTAAGLELKAVVDQFREQVQNLE